jgi:hypothetical protein
MNPTLFEEQLQEAMCPSPAPEDPESFGGPTNADRAVWAEQALQTFNQSTGVDLEDSVADLITDMAHFCDRHGMNIAHEIERARGMYGDETHGQGNQFED